jgi:membrane fusion protein (multidrug efflux system)
VNLRMLSAIAALSVGCAATPSMKALDTKPLETRTVLVAKARNVNRVQADEVVGTVRARTVTAISASIMGTVRTVNVGIGSRVRAGAVLVQLVAGEVEAKANQAGAMFAQAQLDLQRAEQLKTTQSVSAAQVDAARVQFRVAEAALAEANVMRSYTTLRAPFAGVVSEKQCAVGDLALPGKPLLTLENPDALRLEASVPEAIAQVLHKGDVLRVRIDALDTPLDATVSELGASADPATRTVLIKLDLPNLAELRPGMFGRLSVPTGEQHMVVVPTPSVMRRGQMESVFVVSDHKAQLRLVRTGSSSEGGTEVLAGLDDGETVVVSPLAQLVDGQPVEMKP